MKNGSSLNSESIKGDVYLILAAMLWGFGLVAQKEGIAHMGSFSFTSIRCIIGGFSLVPLIIYQKKQRQREGNAPVDSSDERKERRLLIKGAVVTGFVMAAIVLVQQWGLPYTTVGKAGFITALYIVITPLAGRFFLKKSIGWNVWLAVVVALIGFYCISMQDGFQNIAFGDLCMVAAAMACTVHIYLIEYFVKRVDPVKYSSYQFFTAGLVCLVPALIFDNTTWEQILQTIVPILYAGICSCGIGYLFQILGQKRVEPSKASLVLSSETIFTMIAGIFFYGEIMSGREYLGCALIFVGIILSQKTFTFGKKRL